MSKVISASTLEQSGQIEEAIAVYQEIIVLDGEGSYGAIARKALENLQVPEVSPEDSITPELVTINRQTLPEALPPDQQPLPEQSQGFLPRLWKQFLDMPIRNKQLLSLITSETVSVVGLVGIGAILILNNSRQQLVKRAESELAVTAINYNIKINQMGFGFRGQSDNKAIIEAAQAYASSKALPEPLRNQVKGILQQEIKARTIEYATLVGTDGRIIVSANADRAGEAFDPNGLVSAVLANPEQIKTSEIVAWEDLQREAPPLPPGIEGKDALVRYTVTPVFAANGTTVNGVLVSGDIVNGKQPIAANTLETFNGGYSAVYAVDPGQNFALATSLEEAAQEAAQSEALLANALVGRTLPAGSKVLQKAVAEPGTIESGRLNLEGKGCGILPLPWSPKCYTVAAQAVTNSADVPVAVLIRGTSEKSVNRLILISFAWQTVFVLIALIVDVALASMLGRAIVSPVKRLKQVAQSFTKGDRQVRTEIAAQDEIGDLSMTFNEMADSINASEAALAEQSRRQEQEAKRQRQQKEKLQQGVMKLLLDIEGAQAGNLSSTAQVTEGEVGSIADAFNATLRNLRQLVTQVTTVVQQVSHQAQDCSQTVDQLSTSALSQAGEVERTLDTVVEMNTSIQSVAASAAESADIARRALMEAQEGEMVMDQTVDSIEKVRSTVTMTAKKVKVLAESSQEISQIVGIISNISEKTNLLAFNASVEAARAGEHGQGFRVVADEVRRLADRVTESTQEIQQLVNAIQQGTTEVLGAMESSTEEVAAGTQKVYQTKQTLQSLAAISQQIDQNLQVISGSTVSQTEASEQVKQMMNTVSEVAKTTSSETQTVTTALGSLLQDVETLQASVAKFRLEA
jgi:twitching motility protein PilJ